MLVKRYRAYFVRSMELGRKIASCAASGFRPRHAGSCGLNDLDALRERLETAASRVAQSEQLVAGWREMNESQQATGRDLEASRDLLKTFENGLEVAMSNKQEAQKALDQRLLDIFQGAVGRLPQNDQELPDWLASPEGKAATVFELATASRWGEQSRS
jgi:hypothetical protein